MTLPIHPVSIFRDAITGDDGRVDSGYLGMFVVMWVTMGSIPAAIILVTIKMFLSKVNGVHDYPLDLVGLAAILAGAAAGFGTAAGAVGLFRMGDKPHAGTTVVQQSSVSSTTQTPPPTQ